MTFVTRGIGFCCAAVPQGAQGSAEEPDGAHPKVDGQSDAGAHHQTRLRRERRPRSQRLGPVPRELPPPPFIFLLQNVFHDGRFFVGRPATQGENGTSAVLASITKAKGTSRPFEASNAAGHGSAPALVAEVVKVPATAAARMSGGSSGQYRHGEASTSGSSAACNTPVSSSFSPYSLFLRQRSSLAKKEPVSQWMGRHPHLVT